MRYFHSFSQNQNHSIIHDIRKDNLHYIRNKLSHNLESGSYLHGWKTWSCYLKYLWDNHIVIGFLHLDTCVKLTLLLSVAYRQQLFLDSIGNWPARISRLPAHFFSTKHILVHVLSSLFQCSFALCWTPANTIIYRPFHKTLEIYCSGHKNHQS